MMKYILICIVFCLFLNACKEKTQKTISLTVSCTNYPENTPLVLYRLVTDFEPFDTAIVVNGEHHFYKPINTAAFFMLKLSAKEHLNLVLHPNEVTSISVDAKRVLASAQIENNRDSYSILRAERIANNYPVKLNDLISTFGLEPLPNFLKDSLLQSVDTLVKKYKLALTDILLRDSNQISMLPILMQSAGNQMFFNPINDRNLFVKADTFLTRNYGYLDMVMNFHYQLDSILLANDSISDLNLGDMLPEPQVPTIWNENFPLRRFKGKPILLFFWQSGDASNQWLLPEVKSFLTSNSGKKFEVFMISMDTLKVELNRSIEYNRLACWHLCDFKGWNSPIVNRYGLRNTPSNILIDKNGAIVSKNIWGDQLKEALNKQVMR